MKKIFKNGLYMLVAGALVASCADYNDMNGFKAEPDPSITYPYADLAPVKSYIDRVANPNLKIGATLDIKEFNKQELQHSAVMRNFDNVSFGKTLMSGSIISEKGVMNFVSMMDLLEHMDEIGGEVYGSPLAANADQPDKWIKTLIAPIEIPVDYVPGKNVNYNDSTKFNGTVTGGKGVAIKKFDNQNALYLPSQSKTYILEGFDIEPGANYSINFWVNTGKESASFYINFSGNKILGTVDATGKWKTNGGKWSKISIESKAAEGVTKGYLEIEMVRGSEMYVQKIESGYSPDNHRPQTEQEISDTIKYGLNTWCDRFMEINKGRIKQFDLVDEPIDASSVLENEKYDIKHGNEETIFWQDILGSENYGSAVAKMAREAFVKHGGNADELKFFVSETGLEDTKKMESLNYWVGIWDKNGANIDGINAKVNLVCYENADKMAENKKAYETLLDALAKTGKLIRISNVDIKYVDATGAAVKTADITDEQRQKLADYNAYAIKTYMSKIPGDKQAGISKGSLVDSTNDPVGLWTQHPITKDWERNATYKAWCEGLSGK